MCMPGERGAFVTTPYSHSERRLRNCPSFFYVIAVSSHASFSPRMKNSWSCNPRVTWKMWFYEATQRYPSIVDFTTIRPLHVYLSNYTHSSVNTWALLDSQHPSYCAHFKLPSNHTPYAFHSTVIQPISLLYKKRPSVLFHSDITFFSFGFCFSEKFHFLVLFRCVWLENCSTVEIKMKFPMLVLSTGEKSFFFNYNYFFNLNS